MEKIRCRMTGYCCAKDGLGGEQEMGYTTEVQVRKVDKELLLNQYSKPDMVLDACTQCPDYGKNWSCPPGLPDPAGYLEAYDTAFLIAVKVLYSEELREEAAESGEEADRIRRYSYEKVKKRLLLTLLSMEKQAGGGKCLGAGKCLLCGECTRAEGKPCRYPKNRRYSITSFGFDFTKLLGDLFDIELKWSSKGLPEYDVAVAALFCKEKN